MDRRKILTVIAATLLVALAAQPISSQTFRKPKPPPWDIALHNVFVDAQTCQLWVTYKNLGANTITQTVNYEVRVDGEFVQGGLMNFNFDPIPFGGEHSHTVGASKNLKIYGTRTVRARIDYTYILDEPPARRANNELTKTVQGCPLPPMKPPT
jgi:hypothetical protein